MELLVPLVVVLYMEAYLSIGLSLSVLPVYFVVLTPTERLGAISKFL